VELRQLKYFVAVVERSSFSIAADDLHVTQPALSKSLRSLEQDLGVRLLDRGPNGVSPTVYGEQLLAYAQPILSLLAEARSEIDAMRGASKGQLNIGAMPAALRVIVPTAAREFLASRANVKLTVQEGLNEALIHALRNGSLDLVVTVLPAEQFPPEIEYRILQQEPMMIVCRPDHPLMRLDTRNLADLASYEWVVPERQEPDRRQLDRLFVAQQLPKPRVAMETTSVTLLSSLLASSDYLTYLPASSVGEGKDFATLPLEHPTWTRTTVVAYRERGPLRPLLNAFLRTLEGVAKQLGGVG
jgi:DNA-binding transcriptional LysR family regulator